MINYKGTPILGPDSSTRNTSEFFAIAGTVLFWLLFLIFSFVIKPQPKKQYKEVQIVLSSTPVVQKSDESPAPAEQAASAASAPEIVEAPVVETPVETPAPAPVVKETPPAPKPVEKKVETQKTQTKPAVKKEPTPVKKTETPKPAPQKTEPAEPVKYAVDPMEAFAAQTKQTPKKDFDWSQFDDEPEATQTTNTAKTVQSNVPAFSGSAGTAASTADQKVTSTSSTSSSKTQTASASTSNALEGIKKSTYKGTGANGVQTESTAKTKNSGSGKVEMEMSNGRSRALIDPERPVINLSAQAAATIDTSKTVSINFKVLEAGNVIEIKITPESILASIVREEIKTQISKWRFEPADYTATATFEYKIVKK